MKKIPGPAGSLFPEFRFSPVCCDLGIGNSLMNPGLYLIGYFLNISLRIHESVMGGNGYIIQYGMCSHTGIVKDFAGLYFEIVSHSSFNSFSLSGFIDRIMG
jgi:hypothetical protein